MTAPVPLYRWGNPTSEPEGSTWEGSWTDSIRAALHPAHDDGQSARVTVLTSWTWTDPAQLRTAAAILTDAANHLETQVSELGPENIPADIPGQLTLTDEVTA